MNELDIKTADKINSLHNEIANYLKCGIEKAIEIGELLTAKKDELPHGEFGTWIKDNLVFTDRTARNYMKLFENRDKVLNAGNISEAYKMLEESKSETVSVLEVIRDYLKELKTISIGLENNKSDKAPMSPETIYPKLLSEYLEKSRAELQTADDLQTFNRLITEASIIQRKLSEVHLWTMRIMGQLIILSREPIKGVSTRDNSMCKRFANVSYEMFLGLFDE